MKIVCSWCRQEGKAELVGEKAPLDDARETHGICVVHRHDVEAHWQASIHTAHTLEISDRIVFCALPLERLAERDQEDTTCRDRRIFLSIYRELPSISLNILSNWSIRTSLDY